MAEIAVIVPVYRAEDCLRRCIDSILTQTFSGIRLVLVDDGSPDGCPMICDEYAEKDPRVHVIHQPNSGPSAARNRGIDWTFEHSGCEYLVFADSDDCLHPQYLERLFTALIRENAEVSMCRHHYIGKNERIEAMQPLEDLHVHCANAEDLMIAQSDSFNYAWGKLFSKRCFEILRYPENVSFGEDNLIIYQVMFSANRIAFLNEELYFYFYNPDGITKSLWSVSSLDVFTGIEAQQQFYRENGFEQAYRKEIELDIQQCAYQIHRIREDAANMEKNMPHLQELQKRMKRLFRENKEYRPQDAFFWYEALHPHMAAVWNIQTRLLNNIKSNGLSATLKKIINKCRSFPRRESPNALELPVEEKP